MPLMPKTLAKMTRECSFPFAGETVHVTYYPAAFGEDGIAAANRVQEEVQAANASGDEAQVERSLLNMGAWITTIIAAWDFMQDDGVTMQPLTPENLAKQAVDFPEFMQAVITACRENRKQGNANGAPSSAPSAVTSSPEENSASMAVSLNPSDSSSSPDGSAETSPETSTGS